MASDFGSILDLAKAGAIVEQAFQTQQEETKDFIDALCYRYPFQGEVTRVPFSEIPNMMGYKKAYEQVIESDIDAKHIDVDVNNFGVDIPIAWEELKYLGSMGAQALYEAKAQEAAKTASNHVYFWLTSILTGSAVDPTLMPDDLQSTAYDSLSLLNSGTRYGQANGNIYTGTGVTAAQIRNDFFGVVSRYSQFRHTKVNLRLLPRHASRNYMIIFPPSLIQQMTEAFHVEMVAQGGAGTQSVGNTILAFQKAYGATISLHENHLLSGNDWYIVVTNLGQQKPFVMVEYDGPETISYNPMSDSKGRLHYIGGKTIYRQYGLSAFLPYTIMKVDN